MHIPNRIYDFGIGTENTVLVTKLNGNEYRISTEYTVLVTNPLHCARRGDLLKVPEALHPHQTRSK